MKKQQTAIIIFCDGTRGSDKYPAKPHDAVPISAYRRAGRGGDEYWHPIYAVTFRGADYVLEANSIDQLAGDTELTLPDYSGVEQLPVNGPEEALASIGRKTRETERLRQETAGERRRSQYRWHCPQPECYDLPFNDVAAVHRLFDLYSSPQGEVSLATVDAWLKEAKKRRR
jgi:hypothetical protein